MKMAITGHRPPQFNYDYELVSPWIQNIKAELQQLIEKHTPVLMISGMALGIDMLWAELAIENGIELLAAVPCKDQENRWPKKSQDRYRRILDHPNTSIYMVHKGYYNYICMQKRNEWLVDYLGKDDILIGVHNGSAGGTFNCLDYADKKKKNIIIVNPNDFKPKEEDHYIKYMFR